MDSRSTLGALCHCLCSLMHVPALACMAALIPLLTPTGAEQGKAGLRGTFSHSSSARLILSEVFQVRLFWGHLRGQFGKGDEMGNVTRIPRMDNKRGLGQENEVFFHESTPLRAKLKQAAGGCSGTSGGDSWCRPPASSLPVVARVAAASAGAAAEKVDVANVVNGGALQPAGEADSWGAVPR